MYAERAADPTDVFWSNLKFTTKEKNIRRATGFAINCLTLIGSFFLILYLDTLQNNAKDEAIALKKKAETTGKDNKEAN